MRARSGSGGRDGVRVLLCKRNVYCGDTIVRLTCRPDDGGDGDFEPPSRRGCRPLGGARLAYALAPRLVRVLVPLLVPVDPGRSERLLRQRLAAPVALVSPLGLPLVLVTPVELPFTCWPSHQIITHRVDRGSARSRSSLLSASGGARPVTLPDYSSGQ